MMFFSYQHFLSEEVLIKNNTALIVSQRKLEQRNRRLEEIAWIQSHKLRKPVATILGLVQLINFNEPNAGENAKTLGHIKTAGEELDKIIAEIDSKTRLKEDS